MNQQKREKLQFSLLVTFLWGLIAHGYRFFNLDFSHDSLLVFQELDFTPMMSVGRFVQPVWFLIRGNTYPPALVGFLSLLFLGLTVYLTASLLGRETKGSIVILSGILTVNVIVTLTGATYIHDLDIYTLALLLAVWSVVICRSGKWGFLAALVPEILSLGLYQSYIQAAIVLHMMLAILALLRQEDVKQVFREGMKAVISLVLALILYYALYRVMLSVTGTAESTNYNTLSNVGAVSGVSDLVRSVALTVYSVVQFFVKPIAAHSKLLMIVNVLLLGLAGVSLVALIRARKVRGIALLLLIVLIVLMPLAMNVMCILSQGMVHHIMMYACVLAYILAEELCRMYLESCSAQRKQLGSRIVAGLLVLVLADGILYANQVYLKKSLEYNSTVTTMNRILDRVEQTEGYVYGETPVAFVGLLYQSPMTGQSPDFDYDSTGLWHSYAVSFPESYGMYIHNVLNYSMEILTPEQTNPIAASATVQAMGIFPAKDSVAMVDGILVVKLSETE